MTTRDGRITGRRTDLRTERLPRRLPREPLTTIRQLARMAHNNNTAITGRGQPAPNSGLAPTSMFYGREMHANQKRHVAGSRNLGLGMPGSVPVRPIQRLGPGGVGADPSEDHRTFRVDAWRRHIGPHDGVGIELRHDRWLPVRRSIRRADWPTPH